MNWCLLFLILLVYNLDYDHVKALNNRLYAQQKEFRETCDKLHNLRTTVKDLTIDIKNLTSLKYLNEYEIAIQEAFDELFATKTLIKREIIKYYIDNLYASSSNYKILKINEPSSTNPRGKIVTISSRNTIKNNKCNLPRT